MQEYEQLAEAVRECPYLYGKAKKEYKEKFVTKNACKEVADQLIFIENGKLKKNYAICPSHPMRFYFRSGISRNLKFYFVLML